MGIGFAKLRDLASPREGLRIGSREERFSQRPEGAEFAKRKRCMVKSSSESPAHHSPPW
jgi:hypothetical protein